MSSSSFILSPPSVGCSPPETVSLNLIPPFASLMVSPSYVAEGGTGPGGDSRPHLLYGCVPARNNNSNS